MMKKLDGHSFPIILILIRRLPSKKAFVPNLWMYGVIFLKTQNKKNRYDDKVVTCIGDTSDNINFLKFDYV